MFTNASDNLATHKNAEAAKAIALLLGYGMSLPYNFIAVVGVWRAAARYEGPAILADLARAATVMLNRIRIEPCGKKSG